MTYNEEETNWINLWSKLHERVDSGKMPLKQYNAIVRLWHQVSRKVEGIRRPTVGHADSGEYYFDWSFADRDQVITADITKNGLIEWFWLDRTNKDAKIGEGTIEEFIVAMIDKLKLMKGK